MPAVLANEFLALYPEFANYDVDTIDAWLGNVESIHCPSAIWTDPIRQQQAVMLRTAHYLETKRLQMAQTSGAGEAVSTGQSPSIQSTSSKDEFDLTTYGRQFKQLRSTLPTTGFSF